MKKPLVVVVGDGHVVVMERPDGSSAETTAMVGGHVIPVRFLKTEDVADAFSSAPGTLNLDPNAITVVQRRVHIGNGEMRDFTVTYFPLPRTESKAKEQ